MISPWLSLGWNIAKVTRGSRLYYTVVHLCGVSGIVTCLPSIVAMRIYAYISVLLWKFSLCVYEGQKHYYYVVILQLFFPEPGNYFGLN